MEIKSNGFRVEPDRKYGYFSIVREGRGVLPTELRGVYTKSSLAVSAIENWAKKNIKE